MQVVARSTDSSRRRLRGAVVLGALLTITVACSNRESDDAATTAAPATDAPAATSAPTDSEAPPA
ncbi:MAG: chromosome partitioning protein, partial [Ilumatobacteraceae bacterium]